MLGNCYNRHVSTRSQSHIELLNVNVEYEYIENIIVLILIRIWTIDVFVPFVIHQVTCVSKCTSLQKPFSSQIKEKRRWRERERGREGERERGREGERERGREGERERGREGERERGREGERERGREGERERGERGEGASG